MGGVRSFFLGAAKIATAFVITIVVVAVGAWAINSYNDAREAQANAPLAVAKVWPTESVPALDNAQITLLTKWENGQLYYQVVIDRYPSDLKKPRDANSLNPHFSLVFEDKDGFHVFTHDILLSEMRVSVSDSKEYIGLSANGSVYMGDDDYRNSVSWNLTWSF